MNTMCLWRWLGGWCVEDSRSRQSGRRLPLSLSKVLNFGRVMTSQAVDKPPTAWFRESTCTNMGINVYKRGTLCRKNYLKNYLK